jgi:hypothetical protein
MIGGKAMVLKIPNYTMTSVRYGSGQPAAPGPRRAMPTTGFPDRVGNLNPPTDMAMKAGVSTDRKFKPNPGKKPS